MYYRLDSDSTSMTAYVTRVKGASEPLVRGAFIDPARQKLPFRYKYRDRTNNPLFDYYSADSLMSKRLVASLEEAGVDNLQKFESELTDQNTGAINNDFWTVNVLGSVACADVPLSTTSELGSSYYFHDLVIKPTKTGGLLMFRLAESMIDVLIDEKVAKAIEAGDFRGVVLTALKTAP